MTKKEQEEYPFTSQSTVDDFSKFITDFNQYKECYSSMLVKFFSVTNEGVNHILKCLFIPLFEKVETGIEETIFSLEIRGMKLELTKMVFPKSDFNNVKSIFSTRKITIGTKEYYFPLKENDHIRSNIRRLPSNELFQVFRENIAFNKMRFHSDWNTGVFGDEEISDEVLRTAQKPYKDMADLVKGEFFNFGFSENLYRDIGKIPTDLIIAYPLPVFISTETHFDEEGLKLVLYAHENLDIEKIHLGYIGQTITQEIVRKQISLQDIVPLKEELMNRYEILVEDKVIFADVYLSYDEQYFDMNHQYNPFVKTYNPMYNLYKTQDESLEQLEDNLLIDITTMKRKKRTGRQKDFEFSAQMLFSMLGFITLPFGRMKGNDEEIDIALLDPHSANILLVECTLTDIDKGNKIEKFTQKVNMLSEDFDGYDITTLMMSPYNHQKEQSLKKASENSISILLKKDIELLIKYAHQYASPTFTLNFIKGRIPQNELAKNKYL